MSSSWTPTLEPFLNNLHHHHYSHHQNNISKHDKGKAQVSENKNEATIHPQSAEQMNFDFKRELDIIEDGLRIFLDTSKSELTIIETQNRSSKKLRELLSAHREWTVKAILDRNWVPLLLNWLQPKQVSSLQAEALWALTNLAAGPPENAQVLLRAGATPYLISLLTSDNEEVLEQSVWVLGNLAGESVSSRDTVLKAGVIPPLVHCLHTHIDAISLSLSLSLSALSAHSY